MRVLIAVHNLTVEKCHLMPWRTVCDVVKCMREDKHETYLLSLGDRKTVLHGRLIPEETRQIRKAPSELISDLKIEIERTRPDVIFWPIAWRESVRKIKIVTDTNVPVILWFPGGFYSLRACFHALKVVGVRNTLPYLREALSDKKHQVTNFKKYGIKAILAMTTTTADSAVAAGWPETQSYVVPPGKENFNHKSKKTPLPAVFFKKWLADKPFFLFMGPPSGIRGIFELIEAFDLAAGDDREIRLVCLFRSDGMLDSHKVKNTIERCENKDRIYSVWQSLGAEELNSFMAACHTVVMPFVMVPSEIPLAIIEAMAWGKPIITTSPGGTGDFVAEFGLSPRVGDIDALANAMIKLLKDNDFYKEKCQKTIDAYAIHPDWRSVSRQWTDVARKSLVKGK